MRGEPAHRLLHQRLHAIGIVYVQAVQRAGRAGHLQRYVIKRLLGHKFQLDRPAGARRHPQALHHRRRYYLRFQRGAAAAQVRTQRIDAQRTHARQAGRRPYQQARAGAGTGPAIEPQTERHPVAHGHKFYDGGVIGEGSTVGRLSGVVNPAAQQRASQGQHAAAIGRCRPGSGINRSIGGIYGGQCQHHKQGGHQPGPYLGQ